MKNLIIRSGLALALLAVPAIALAPDFAANALRSATATVTGLLSAGTVATPTANIGTLRMVNGLSPLDLTYATIKNPNAIMLGVGNRISFCPALSCVYGPPDGSVNAAFADHQRTSLLVSTETQDDSHSEEQTLAVMTTVKTGYLKKYLGSTAYAVGDNIAVGNAVYRVTQAGTTSASSPPPGSRPNAVPFMYLDGSVRWLWINDAAIASKVGIYNEVKNVAGGGSSWAQANNFELEAGHKPDFNINTEFDFTNNSGTDCTFGTNCINLYVSMAGSNKSTAGITVVSPNTTNPAAYWGLRLNGPKLASDAVIAIDANSKYGIAANQLGLGGDTFTGSLILDNSSSPSFARITGAKSVAVLDDVSTAPAGIAVGGTKSLAGISVSATTPTGISLSGTFSQSQIAGQGWRVDPAGALTASGFTAGTSPGVSCSGPPTSNFQVTNGIVTRC